MKIKCDFCKTEYSVDKISGGVVKCAVCGHTWTIAAPARRNAFLTFVAALCALMSAVVFAVAVVARHGADNTHTRPIVATISKIGNITDDAGVPHLVVDGAVHNRSDEIYGVPDLVIVSRDADGREIARQKFMPSATLLDPGASAPFSHTLSASAVGVFRVTIEMPEIGDAQ